MIKIRIVKYDINENIIYNKTLGWKSLFYAHSYSPAK